MIVSSACFGVLLVVFQRIVNAIPGSFIVTQCYGSVLHLSCNPGHRIKVLDDFFGLRTARVGEERDECRYEPGDCTVTNGRYTSVIHRYCEGKQTCTSFQVDRRFCGANQTTYEQVEYECIPDSVVTDMCAQTSYTAREGYIATPNFPTEYPTSMDCRCSLQSSDPSAKIQLEATHFIIRFDRPCKDWLEISIGDRNRKLCGAYRSTLQSSGYNLTFHSDGSGGHQGVWLFFSLFFNPSNATIKINCQKLDINTTESTTTITTTTVTEEPLVLVDQISTEPSNDNVADHNQSSTKGDIIPSTTPSTTIGHFVNTSPTVGENINVVSSKRSARLTWTTSTNTVVLDKTTKATIVAEDNNVVKENQGLHANIITTEDPSTPKTDLRSQQEIDRQKNKTTGVIIISICIGGIVLLILILAILLCVSKRKNPKNQAEKDRKLRLQQRLNSLSFYDSIPLYDSIGRRTGASRSPTLVSDPPAGLCNPGLHSAAHGHVLDPKRLPWSGKEHSYFSPNAHDLESDHDSAIYAELDKNSRSGLSDADTPRTRSPTRRTPNGEGPPGYSLNLKHADKEEDIYTHV